MKKKDRRKFRKVVGNIRQAERDVDKVLRAAKVRRSERPSILEGATFPGLVLGAVLVLGLGGLFALAILSILLG